WDGGRSWINTSTLFLRYNAMKGYVDGTRDRGAKSGRPMRMERMETDAPLAALAEEMTDLPEPAKAWRRGSKPPPRFSAPQPPYDPLPVIEKERLHSPEKVVEHYAHRLLQMPLTRDRRKVLVEALEGDGGAFDPRLPGAAERVR